ncbi:MAG TPA: hypothetical protein VEQ37_06885 [Actinomycetota bacterium]|nr:hypothetical protein [Actinomycetota bacterium]
MRAEGAVVRFPTERVGASEPTYSPDGSKIALFRDGHIWVMDASGSNARDVSHLDASFSPRWSPDGTKIAFTTYDSSWRAELNRDENTRDLPVLTLSFVDVQTGQIHDVGGAQVATDSDGRQWLPSGDALLIDQVRRR